MNNCVFEENENICIALRYKQCEYCRFYKSSEQYHRVKDEHNRYIGVEKNGNDI